LGLVFYIFPNLTLISPHVHIQKEKNKKAGGLIFNNWQTEAKAYEKN
jgi:hypothetical protein